jgi:hypothetical protein
MPSLRKLARVLGYRSVFDASASDRIDAPGSVRDSSSPC